ncbi:MAG TPA: hypothetical protein VGG38_06745 [Acidimicrobiales bacterium]|jgi:hypothetical protein
MTKAGLPTALAATYTDVPAGRPGYALIVNPGPAGSGRLGGLAVYEYQDGKEVAYFSFYGVATSDDPFQVTIKGDQAAASATVVVTPESNSSITVDNCARFFSPAVANGIAGLSDPPAPPVCTFTYKLAPGPPRTQPTATTNMTATATIKSDLLMAYLNENGWQANYSSDITLTPGSTYVAYDPATGLDWAYAKFTYSGPATSASNTPSVGMQDGGNEGYFYDIPLPGSVSQQPDGWTMVGVAGDPGCYSDSVVPSSVTSIWGLSDSPVCT